MNYIGEKKVKTGCEINIFKDVRRNVVSSTHTLDSNYYEACCQDNYVGNLIIEDNKISSSDVWISPNARRENPDKIKNKKPMEYYKTLVIILESPHKKEYNQKNGDIVPAPALGKTGHKLAEYFDDMVNSSTNLDNGKYRVILMNAIQYQCSLGLKTNIYRDRMWLKLWIDKRFDKDFIQRLKYYNPNVIFNLCTLGGHTQDPKLIKGCKTVINKIYIEEVCNIRSPENLENKGYKNTLKYFVQKAIREYKVEKEKEGIYEIEIIMGIHPSAPGFNSKTKFNKWKKE